MTAASCTGQTGRPRSAPRRSSPTSRRSQQATAQVVGHRGRHRILDELERRFEPDLLLLESGGDNLTATFSRALVDVQLFVIDVAGGDKVPRKGGPGVTASDLLVVNKTDLAPLVGADLDVMRRDSATVRGTKPTLLISLREDPAATEVAGWVREQVRARAGFLV